MPADGDESADAPCHQCLAAAGEPRRHATLGRALLSGLAMTVMFAVSGCTESRRAGAEVPEVSGASLEPTPYVMSSASDKLVRARREPFADQLRVDRRSLGWQLVELREGGRQLVIDYSPGCEEDRGAVQVQETGTHVLVRVSHPEPVSEYSCVLTWRRIVELAQPLGDRQLLHAA